MIRRLTFRFSTSLAAIAIFALVFVPSGFAATYEQMVEQCREQARPAVVACVHNKGGCGGSGSRFGRGGGGGPNPEIIEACRASVGKPLVFACVDRLQQRQAAGTPAPAAPKEEKAAAPVHLRQFVSLQYKALGDPQNSIAMAKLIERDGNIVGQRGSLVEAEAETLPPAETVEVAAADQPGADAVTRGLPLRRRASPHTEDVDAAELAMLPRLPDTRLELTTIAKVLNVDPAKALYLGKAANEQNVETMDLSRFRIVAFATHGLVPGDIDGLTQPALALTAPQVAGVKGNGLLTMEKILALKLDADWAVLSACNTAAGAGAGAEAASGLGMAFFYAGTRALLVTNWPVKSASARELTSDLFRRVAADQSLTRAEALRQAMMAVLDGPGSVDSSDNTVFTYAHPLFWAPYTLIGDGG